MVDIGSLRLTLTPSEPLNLRQYSYRISITVLGAPGCLGWVIEGSAAWLKQPVWIRQAYGSTSSFDSFRDDGVVGWGMGNLLESLDPLAKDMVQAEVESRIVNIMEELNYLHSQGVFTETSDLKLFCARHSSPLFASQGEV